MPELDENGNLYTHIAFHDLDDEEVKAESLHEIDGYERAFGVPPSDILPGPGIPEGWGTRGGVVNTDGPTPTYPLPQDDCNVELVSQIEKLPTSTLLLRAAVELSSLAVGVAKDEEELKALKDVEKTLTETQARETELREMCDILNKEANLFLKCACWLFVVAGTGWFVAIWKIIHNH